MKAKNSACEHLAIILDGNGRWAKQRGLTRHQGHEQGAKTAIDIVRFCAELSLKNVTLYCLSTENMKRPEVEVAFLIELLANTLLDNLSLFIDKKIKVNVLGNLLPLGSRFTTAINKVTQATADFQTMQLNVLCNYSGRWHIEDAHRRAMLSAKNDGSTDSSITSILQSDMSKDPDLLIRTSGEQRLSNFMLYHSAYTELAFEAVFWPDFTREHLVKHLDSFTKRQRRYGQVEQEDALTC